jgi:hypothetical protein
MRCKNSAATSGAGSPFLTDDASAMAAAISEIRAFVARLEADPSAEFPSLP